MAEVLIHRDELVDTLEVSRHSIAKLDATEASEVAAFQLLCAAQRWATHHGKVLALEGMNAELVVHSAGQRWFCRSHACARGEGGRCLWVFGRVRGA